MKKIIFVFLTIFLIVGCGNTKLKPISLSSEYYYRSEIIEIDSNEFAKLKNSSGSFAVYVYLNGCTTCQAFKNVLDEYLKDNKLTIYSIEFSELKKTSMYSDIKYSPSFVIFKSGNIYTYLDPMSDDDIKYYKDVEGFSDWIKKYIIMESGD